MTDDITKHKDWQSWIETIFSSSEYLYPTKYSAEHALKTVAPLIFAAGREAAQAEITVLKQRVADAEDDADELRNPIYYLERGE